MNYFTFELKKFIRMKKNLYLIIIASILFLILALFFAIRVTNKSEVQWKLEEARANVTNLKNDIHQNGTDPVLEQMLSLLEAQETALRNDDV